VIGTSFAGLLSNSGQVWIAVSFAVAVVLGWVWVSVTAAQLLREPPAGGDVPPP
jgi:hypothetical protein